MKSFIIRLLKRVLNYLEPTPEHEARTRELIFWADTLKVKGQEVSGQRKRRQVLLRLRAEFPRTPVKELSFTLEKILQEV